MERQSLEHQLLDIKKVFHQGYFKVSMICVYCGDTDVKKHHVCKRCWVCKGVMSLSHSKNCIDVAKIKLKFKKIEEDKIIDGF